MAETEQRSIPVPSILASVIDEIVQLQAARTGEDPERVRRGVEIACLTRGAKVLREELAPKSTPPEAA